jgi:hypothetical protein
MVAAGGKRASRKKLAAKSGKPGMKWSEAYEHSGWTIVVPVKLIHAIGAKGAILVAQLFYWSGKQQSEDAWIYKTQLDLEKETGLSRHEQNKCVEDLKKKNVLETRYERLDHRLYYRINRDALDEIMEADSPSEIRKTDFGKSENRISGNPESHFRQNRKTAFGNIEQENTTEITHKRNDDDQLKLHAQVVTTPSVVVVASSWPDDDDEPSEIVEKLTEKLKLSYDQSQKVQFYLDQAGEGYVLEKLRITRSKDLRNAGGFFMRALEKDFREPVTNTKPPPPAKKKRVEPKPEEPAATDEERVQTSAKLKEFIETLRASP